MDDKNFVMVMIGTIAAVIIITLGINMMLADYWSTADSDDRFDYKNDTKIATALLYGDCRDGDVNITTNTTITEDMFYQNLFINYTKRINGNGWKIFVCNYTYFYGDIWNKGNNGLSAAGSTGGAGGTQANGGNAPPNSAGGAGKTGTTGSGVTPTPASPIDTCMSNYSTTGGNGGTGSKGSAGATSSLIPFCTNYMTRNYLGMDYQRIGTTTVTVYTASGSLGGASGGGSASSAGTGGGGGGGGASGGGIWLSSKNIVFDATNSPPYINAIGGHGGTGGTPSCQGSCCGGGGGGQAGTGGFVMITYDDIMGDLAFYINSQFNVSGGIGGISGSKSAAPCGDGTIGGDGGCGKCVLMDADDGIMTPCGCDVSFTATAPTLWVISTPAP